MLHRYKLVPIAPDTLFNLVKGGTFEVMENSFPKDSKVINFFLSFETNTIMLVVESKEFEEVLEGATIPLYTGDILIKKIK